MCSAQELLLCLFSFSAKVILASFTLSSVYYFICIYHYSIFIHYYKHLHLVCIYIYKFYVNFISISLVLDIKLNNLTLKFLTISGTHNFAYRLLILLQLTLHLLVLLLKGKNTVSSLLALTVSGLTFHS